MGRATKQGLHPPVCARHRVSGDLATAQDLCREAISKQVATDRMPNSDNWSALTQGGKGLKDKS